MLDKNPQQVLDNEFIKIKSEFSVKGPNIIVSSKTFLKSEFVKRLVNSTTFPVIFLDFDLLYTGYIKSGMIKKNENVCVFLSSKDTWKKDLKEVIKKISNGTTLVVLDSLNGIYNMLDEIESVRFINSIIMLLSSIAKETKSMIVVTAMVIKNDDGELILSPSGRHILESKNSAVYNLGLSKTSLILNSIDKKDDFLKSFKIKK